jgi:hypothetical protein
MQPAFHAIVPPERYFKALVILGFLLLFCAIADLALGIANAVVCGLFGSIGYGIWGSIIVNIINTLSFRYSMKCNRNRMDHNHLPDK